MSMHWKLGQLFFAFPSWNPQQASDSQFFTCYKTTVKSPQKIFTLRCRLSGEINDDNSMIKLSESKDQETIIKTRLDSLNSVQLSMLVTKPVVPDMDKRKTLLTLLSLPIVAVLSILGRSTSPAFAAPTDPSDYGVKPRRASGNSSLDYAVFAMGCFWCAQKPFDVLPGVAATVVGYCGGKERNPTYDQVSLHRTGHAECVKVIYDPALVSYRQLLDVFWHNIDPTTKDREFCDAGRQYRTSIFYHSEEQRKEAEASKVAYDESGVFKKGPLRKGLDGSIVTEIVAIKDEDAFWDAEDYHQNYYKKNPQLYAFYRANCGRDRYLEAVWGESDSSFSLTDIPLAIQQRLTPKK